jgi:hypothetical protein
MPESVENQSVVGIWRECQFSFIQHKMIDLITLLVFAGEKWRASNDPEAYFLTPGHHFLVRTLFVQPNR